LVFFAYWGFPPKKVDVLRDRHFYINILLGCHLFILTLLSMFFSVKILFTKLTFCIRYFCGWRFSVPVYFWYLIKFYTIDILNSLPKVDIFDAESAFLIFSSMPNFFKVDVFYKVGIFSMLGQLTDFLFIHVDTETTPI
jgi:hypothetical protein